MTRLGEVLKAAREEKGVTLEQAEAVTHIRRHLLVALEENDPKKIPSVVTRGLIRNYAKYLELDPVEALKLYDGNGYIPIKGQRLTSNGIEFMDLSMAPRPWINWDFIFGVALFLLVIGGFGYLAYSTVLEPGLPPTPTQISSPDGQSNNAALLLPTVTPLPTNTPTPLPPTATPTPIVYSGVTVDLVIRESSWVQILADDAKAFEGILQPGDTRSWTGLRRVAIRAGNAGGVEVIVNGTNRGLMGAENQVVDQIWEKVDDPLLLTPQASQPITQATNSLSPTVTLETAPPTGETPLPLESAATPSPPP